MSCDKNLEHTFNDLALLHAETVAHLSYLSIYALNYTYVDFNSKKMVISGTESAWLVHSIETGLQQDCAARLQEHAHDWVEDSPLSQAYAAFMQAHQPDVSWRKTDFGFKGKHGFHLLEVGHTAELGIDSFNALVDALNEFKYESMRLQQKYPQMVFDVTNMDAILAMQATFAEQEKQQLESMKLELDASLFEPLPEPTLTEAEDQALSLRVQWHEDDEIAEIMQCSLLEVKQLFEAIKDKYQQPRIPQRVYLNKRQQLFPELFA